MARLLRVNVGPILDPETGRSVVLMAGTSVPAWAADLITNPKAFDDEDGDGGVAEPDLSDSGADDGVTPSQSDPPPRSGKGSGLDAWLAYAETLGIEVPDNASRDDVINAVDNAPA